MFDNIFLFLFSHATITFLIHSYFFHADSVDISSLPSVISCYERKFSIELMYDFLVGNLFIILHLIMNMFPLFLK